MDSKIGLVIQFAAVLFLTTLMFLLTQSLKSATLSYWKKSWLSVLLALFSLHFAFNFTEISQPFYFFYYLGEYIFGYFLVAGCYKYSTDKDFPTKSWFFIVPAGLIALYLAISASDFNNIFNFHAFIIGTIFIVAFLLVRPNADYSRNLGLKVVRFSLVLLAIDFYHYSFLFSFTKELFSDYLSYNPIIDLMLEILLGFGMVIVLLEKVRHEVEEANQKLKVAHEKLELLAQTDPLTTAFNRHAFYGFLRKKGGEENEVSGCVGFFDIDNLKPINDQLGHAVGDAVIREVTSAIRSLMRAEDLIFRWGGDEFFVIMVSMDSETARKRMKKLTNLLTDVSLYGTTELLTISVSFGFTDFADASEIEKAVKLADQEMYQNKQERKAKESTVNFVPKSQPTSQISA